MTEKVDGRTLRWEKHRARRRTVIVDAAITEISEKGPDVGVEAIAARAKIPRPVVYRLFRDREELDDAIRARILSDFLAKINPELAPAGVALTVIDHAVATYVAWVADNRNLHQFLGIGSASKRIVGARAVTGARTGIAVQISALVAAAIAGRGGDTTIAEPLGFGLVGFVDGCVNRWINHIGEPGQPSRVELQEFLTRTVWSMIASTFDALGLDADPGNTIAPLGEVPASLVDALADAGADPAGPRPGTD